jgi:hypothetical protein
VRPGLTIRRRVAFWIVTYLFAAIMLGTTLPTPLYVIYQAQWHFSSGITTVIFASYAVGVLAALLLAGRSSDQAGRRPVLAAVNGRTRPSRRRVQRPETPPATGCPATASRPRHAVSGRIWHDRALCRFLWLAWIVCGGWLRGWESGFR